MNEPQTPTDSRAALDLGRLLGQRRALTAVAGRCTAAHAQLLRRIHADTNRAARCIPRNCNTCLAC